LWRIPIIVEVPIMGWKKISGREISEKGPVEDPVADGKKLLALI